MDSDYKRLVDFCKERICNTEKLYEICTNTKKKKPLFPNSDQKKFYTMCDNILKDPYFKEPKELEPPLYKEIELLDVVEEELKKRGPCIIVFSEGQTHYLNMKLDIERFSYPFQRILAVEKYEYLPYFCG